MSKESKTLLPALSLSSSVTLNSLHVSEPHALSVNGGMGMRDTKGLFCIFTNVLQIMSPIPS